MATDATTPAIHIPTKRRRWQTLPDKDKTRILKAMITMIKTNPSGRGSNRFFQNARNHGLDMLYCTHFETQFAPWHRIYIYLFELDLQAADIANGRDGAIGVPYWDWSSIDEAPIYEMPPDPRRHLFAGVTEYTPDFYPSDRANPRVYPSPDNDVAPNQNPRHPVYPLVMKRYPWEIIKNDLLVKYADSYGTVPQQAYSCLNNANWMDFSHADGGNTNNSLEKPHNNVHRATGEHMSLVAWAAFDFIFWMHHSNVDRFFEAYLQLHPDAEAQYRRDDSSSYNKPLAPFKKPDGEYYMPTDGMQRAAAFGYKYEGDLPTPPPVNLMLFSEAGVLKPPQQLAVFHGIVVPRLKYPTNDIGVFVMPQSAADSWSPLPSDQWTTDQFFAGANVLFTGGIVCESCAVRRPIDLSIDITSSLERQNLPPCQAVLRVLVNPIGVYGREDQFVLEPNDGSGIPFPVIVGPFCSDGATSGTTRKDISDLQEYLSRFGYYDGPINGEFGGELQEAVQNLQRSAGLEPTGTLNDETREKIVNSPRCGTCDVGTLQTFYNGRKQLTYSVGDIPAYMNESQVVEVVAQSFQKYENACDFNFSFVDAGDDQKSGPADIDIKFVWSSKQNQWNVKSPKFGQAGGAIANGGEGFIHFDLQEHWTCDESEIGDLSLAQSWRGAHPVIYFPSVCLHEIGHAIGLNHAPVPGNVMSPFYDPNVVELTQGDQEQTNQL